jgi:hypothetical protein
MTFCVCINIDAISQTFALYRQKLLKIISIDIRISVYYKQFPEKQFKDMNVVFNCRFGY